LGAGVRTGGSRGERAQRQAERAVAQLARATAAERKAAEREAKRLHEEARLAEVAALNAQLVEAVDEIDSILVATLDVDDFVDLEKLRVKVNHPPFPGANLEVAQEVLAPWTTRTVASQKCRAWRFSRN
jgi:restriction system protein